MLVNFFETKWAIFGKLALEDFVFYLKIALVDRSFVKIYI